jgi:hypothetical protein
MELDRVGPDAGLGPWLWSKNATPSADAEAYVVVEVSFGAVPKAVAKTGHRRTRRQERLIRKALFPGPSEVELAGLEPATSWVRSRRSPS